MEPTTPAPSSMTGQAPDCRQHIPATALRRAGLRRTARARQAGR